MIKKFLIMTLAVFTAACSSDNGKTDDPPVGNGDNFDRGTLLTDLADNTIIPAYQDLGSKLSALVAAKDDFIATPDQPNLDGLRTAWLNAYKVWQHVEMFNIGKAEEIQYGFQMNTYPASVTEIESNISSASYDLGHVNNFVAVGFPAVDYLLYGVEGTDEAILEKYTTNGDAAKYKTYLSDVVDQMKSLTETVLNDWIGAYRSAFIASTTNTAASAVNKLVNDYIFYYEKGLRANKVGIPAGIYSMTPLPEKVEALYHKEVSKELILEALMAVQNAFNGKHYGSSASGEGFKSYLESLDKSDLATSINTKLDAAREKINVLDNSFYEQVNTDNIKMTQAFDALQEVVVLVKVDMLQAFNISVDYVDADGD
ncbi:Iron-regulated protein A precursor [hydrothermal vent metagenome]|uniref:Iron-regulated protein A n=1 Tax=hydrothermal vent metagenome TaxID=652676 RepID=A0A3B0SZA6_9ZZZZ